MSILLTQNIFIAGVLKGPADGTLTLATAQEAEYVNRGVARYVVKTLTPGEDLRPANFNAAATALVNPVTGVAIPLNDTIRRAITAAKGNNPVELEPWLLPELWTITTTYYNGQIVRNSAGNAYMRWHNQSSPGVGVVSTGTEPVHKTQVPTLDGAAGNYWMYRGKARGLAAGTYASATPALSTDTMAGYVAVCTNAEAQALGLTQGLGAEFSYTNFPGRLIGLRDTSRADTLNPVMLGANTGSVAVPASDTSVIHYGIHFKTNARWLFLQPASPVYTGVDRLVIEVNGRAISDSAMSRPNAVQKDGRLIDLSKFPGAIKDVVIYGRDGIWQEVLYLLQLEPTAYILPGEAPVNGLKIAFEGDSLTAGGNGMPTFEGDFWPSNCAKTLGASNYYSNPIGSTGFINNNSGALTTYLERIAKINSFAPDVLVIMGAHNDSASTSAARKAAVLLYLQTFRAANPNAYIFMFGNLLLQGETVATQQTSELDLSSAVTTFNDPRCTFVPILNDPKGSWYAGGSVNGYNFYTTASSPFTDSHHTIGAYKMLEQIVAAKIRNYFAS